MRGELLAPRRWKMRWLVAVAAMGLLVAGCIPGGTYEVATSGFGKVSPGLYRTLGTDHVTGGWCNWQRLDASGAVVGQGPWVPPAPYAGDSATETGPLYTDILPSDATFTSHSCALFWKVSSPGSNPQATPGEPFGPGDFLVGPEVAPGTYTAPQIGFSCSWARVRDFRGSPSSIIQQGGSVASTPTVTIEATDYGFQSGAGCFNWVKVN
jgi:hypothetical protein